MVVERARVNPAVLPLRALRRPGSPLCRSTGPGRIGPRWPVLPRRCPPCRPPHWPRRARPRSAGRRWGPPTRGPQWRRRRRTRCGRPSPRTPCHRPPPGRTPPSHRWWRSTPRSRWIGRTPRRRRRTACRHQSPRRPGRGPPRGRTRWCSPPGERSSIHRARRSSLCTPASYWTFRMM